MHTLLTNLFLRTIFSITLLATSILCGFSQNRTELIEEVVRVSLGVTIREDLEIDDYDHYVEQYKQVQTNPDSGVIFLAQALSIALRADDKRKIYYTCAQLASQYFMLQDLEKVDFVTSLCRHPDEYDTKYKDFITCMKFRGFYYMEQQQSDSALFNLNGALEYANNINHSQGIIDGHGDLGLFYRSQDLYDQAIEAFLKSKDVAEIAKDSLGAVIALINIAGLQGNMSDFETAQFNTQKARSLLPNSESKYLPRTRSSYEATLHQIEGISLMYLREYEEALVAHDLAHQKANLSREPRAIYSSLINLAHLHLLMKNLAIAEDYIYKCFDHPYSQYELYQFRQYTLLSNINFAQGSCQNSIKHIQKAQKFLKDESDLTYLGLFYEAKVKLQSCIGRTDSSDFYLQKYKSIQDSMYFNRKEIEAKRVEAKYQLKSSQDSIAILNLQSGIQDNQIQDRNRLILLSTIIIGLLSALIFLLYKRHRYNLSKIESTNQKLNFFTNVAHELQTPLTIISGALKNILKNGHHKEDIAEHLNLIERNTDSLLSTSHQILSLSQIEINNLNPIEFRAFHLGDFMEHVISDFYIIAANKNFDIEIIGIPKEPITIYSDINKLKTILENLIGNAIKALESQNGKIVIDYSSDHVYHILSIKDNGTGISEHDLDHIFDRFYQGRKASINGGFGIGLAICKQFIEQLGGAIWAQSTEGLGSIFTFSIPKTPAQESGSKLEFVEFTANSNIEQIEILDDADELLTTPELLIVEDNLEMCQYLKSILVKDYHIKFIYNGEEAITYLHSHKPEIIIVDWMLPHVDGIEIVKFIKSNPHLHPIPVLMLTARNFLTDKLKAIQVGVDDYLRKPFDSDELHARLHHLLRARENRVEGLIEINSPVGDHSDSIYSISPQDKLWLLELEEKLKPVLQDSSLDMDRVAKMVDFSMSKTNRKIKSLTGYTGKRYIRELRLWRARHLLETGRYQTVKQVSYAVGFKNQRYFSRIFKDRFGRYPSEY